MTPATMPTRLTAAKPTRLSARPSDGWCLLAQIPRSATSSNRQSRLRTIALTRPPRIAHSDTARNARPTTITPAGNPSGWRAMGIAETDSPRPSSSPLPMRILRMVPPGISWLRPRLVDGPGHGRGRGLPNRWWGWPYPRWAASAGARRRRSAHNERVAVELSPAGRWWRAARPRAAAGVAAAALLLTWLGAGLAVTNTT